MMKKKSQMALNDLPASSSNPNSPTKPGQLQSQNSTVFASPPVMLKNLNRKQSIRLSVSGAEALITTKLNDISIVSSMNNVNNIKMMGHVPYLNSKLTHFLKDSLGGVGKTMMILNIAAMNESYHQTVCVYEYAARGRKCFNFSAPHVFEISSSLESAANLSAEFNILRQLKAKLYAPPATEKKPAVPNVVKEVANNQAASNNPQYLSILKQKTITLTVKSLKAEDVPYLFFPLKPFISLEIGNVVNRTAP